MINIGFITGARSEYGIMKSVISEIASDKHFNTIIVATGMHFLHKYGETIEEIRKDALASIVDAPCYTEDERDKVIDFTSLINVLYETISKLDLDVVYIIGDRLEAYAAAITAHFLKIRIVHFAGGQITLGAVDNIYRYNISNLTSLHLVTNIYAAERLSQIPIIRKDKIFCVGSSAIDSIYAYLENPIDASIIDSRLRRGNYVLMTYHSETKSARTKNTISEAVALSIRTILDKGVKVLATYPNNDDGSSAIIHALKKWEKNPNVIIKKNLGASLYYVAVDNSLFVVGNSSSGIIEVPYFQKYTINVGERQSGRNAPQSVISVPNEPKKFLEALQKTLLNPICSLPQEYIYGKGRSVREIHKILLTEINKVQY
jgi:UDP-hydrolysing UDP-N-acetyl-D-glucosamine 2-epimerase